MCELQGKLQGKSLCFYFTIIEIVHKFKMLNIILPLIFVLKLRFFNKNLKQNVWSLMFWSKIQFHPSVKFYVLKITIFV